MGTARSEDVFGSRSGPWAMKDSCPAGLLEGFAKEWEFHVSSPQSRKCSDGDVRTGMAKQEWTGAWGLRHNDSLNSADTLKIGKEGS